MDAAPASPEVLLVWLGDRPVGELRDFGFGRVSFEFGEEALLRHGAGSRFLSLSLPCEVEPVDVDLASSFFRGLLPEGAVLQRIAQELRVSDNDCFALLVELGGDCAGALTIAPPDTPADPGAGSIEWLGEDELEARLLALPTSPLGIEPGGRVRLSLAGAQDKLVVAVDPTNGRIGLPLDGRPSTHILKPPSTRRDAHGTLLYPDLVANEAFCMRLAGLAGLAVADVEVRKVGGLEALLVTRFDREHVGTSVTRIHQEDACQALGIDPLHKYEEHGGPGLATVAGLLHEYAAAPLADVFRLLELAMLNVLLGNTDAHGKNISLLHLEEGGVALAPAYDLVSTVVYERHDPRLAMRVGAVAEIDAIDYPALERAYESCGVPAATARRRITQIGDRVRAALPGALERAQGEGWHAPVVDQIAARVQRTLSAVFG